MQSHTGRLTTHVLDTALGKPAEGLRIDLFRIEGEAAERIGSARTNDDGRCDPPLLSGERMKTGTYELRFHAGDYLGRKAGGVAVPRHHPDPLRHRRRGARTTTCRCFFRLTAIRPIAGAEAMTVQIRNTIRFLLNHRLVELSIVSPVQTLLDFLQARPQSARHQRRLRRRRLRRLHGAGRPPAWTDG